MKTLILCLLAAAAVSFTGCNGLKNAALAVTDAVGITELKDVTVPVTVNDAKFGVVEVDAPVFERVVINGQEQFVRVKEHTITLAAETAANEAANWALGLLAGTGGAGAAVSGVGAWILAARRQKKKDDAVLAEKDSELAVERKVSDSLVSGVEAAKVGLTSLAENSSTADAPTLVSTMTQALAQAQEASGVRATVRARVSEKKQQAV